MKSLVPFFVFAIVSVLATGGMCQERTLARLNHEAAPATPGSVAVSEIRPLSNPTPLRSALLPESVLSRTAARALFVDADLSRTRTLATRALQRDQRDAEALFVLMEAAGMQAADAVMLDAALRLCELGSSAPADTRVRLAAVRIRESAANTAMFRKAIPRVQRLLANASLTAPDLHAALLNAAMDGAPGLDPYAISRAAGVLTDWRIVGPLGRHSLLDFDQNPISSNADLGQLTYQNRRVENFQFPDGRITLPEYFPHHGTFYAASQFASLLAGKWTMMIEGGGLAEVFVDGQSLLRRDATRDHSSADFDVSAGPHRVLVKFAGGVTPLRIVVSRAINQAGNTPRGKISAQELTYLLAAERYSAAEYGTAIRQVNALPASGDCAALQFLLAQAWSRRNPSAPEINATWLRLETLAPAALSADVALGQRVSSNGNFEEATARANRVFAARPDNVAALEILTAALDPASDLSPGAEQEDLWARRIDLHPSCEGLEAAIEFYRSRDLLAKEESTKRSLDGCAPESLLYAESLAGQGSHAQAVLSLQRLLSAAPLNRAARFMLIGELQLAGQDLAAQRAAAEWQNVSPNAESYRRLASSQIEEVDEAFQHPPTEDTAFYAAYRRDVLEAIREIEDRKSAANSIMLLDDHVAIARPDGSVSLYVHTARRLLTQKGIEHAGSLALPSGAQALQRRLIHRDGTIEKISESTPPSDPTLMVGDTVDDEYVMHYAGDGGIPQHSEVFQFVFGSFDEAVLSSKFVALTPAGQADRGAVIATGEAPHMYVRLQNGMLARTWQREELKPTNLSASTTAIVRIVEQDNGWAVPSNAEHQRRIETIHRGPRMEDSARRVRQAPHRTPLNRT